MKHILCFLKNLKLQVFYVLGHTKLHGNPTNHIDKQSVVAWNKDTEANILVECY